MDIDGINQRPPRISYSRHCQKTAAVLFLYSIFYGNATERGRVTGMTGKSLEIEIECEIKSAVDSSSHAGGEEKVK